MVEAWGDDVPRGKVTDFYGAVQAKDDETVVFSWFEYPDRATRDAANEKMMSDPRMEEMGAEMPFDGQRMIFGGFEPIVDERADGALGLYRRLHPPRARRQASRPIATWPPRPPASSRNMARSAWSRPGATTCRDGKVTDFKKAVKAEAGENVVFSWIEWPDKATRDAAWEKMMEDPDMQPDKDNMPFDGMRMFWGGFAPILDTASATPGGAARARLTALGGGRCPRRPPPSNERMTADVRSRHRRAAAEAEASAALARHASSGTS